MAYEKTIWKGRKGSGLNRFGKTQETSQSVFLNNNPITITQPGTPISVENMNKIEQGIYDAHELAAIEKQERQESDQELQQALNNESQARTEAIQNHNTGINAHADIRDIINNFIGLPAWNSGSHILTFTAKNGATLEVDLPLEDLAKDIDFDPETKEIILIKHDGTEIRIDVGDLVDVYTGSIGTNIQITIDSDNQIHAALLAGSITKEKLSALLLAELVQVSGNQNISGVKTFSEIPVLPSADPASDNEAVRKRYVDIIASAKIPNTEKGAANGVATLDDQGLIPAQQIPQGGGLVPVSNIDFPLGTPYDQKPGDPTPAEYGYRGLWLPWNERAEKYEMITEASYTSIFSALPTSWTSSATIAANQYRIWTPGGDTAAGTRRIIRCTTAVTSQSPLAMNPINWADLSGITYVQRRQLHNNIWNDDDLMIGDQVTYNGQAMRIVGILTMSGLFLSYSGGNRPQFNGGVQRDRIRNAEGWFASGNTGLFQGAMGVFVPGDFNTPFAVTSGAMGATSFIGFNLSKVVLCGNDIAPVTLSEQFWRLVFKN